MSFECKHYSSNILTTWTLKTERRQNLTTCSLQICSWNFFVHGRAHITERTLISSDVLVNSYTSSWVGQCKEKANGRFFIELFLVHSYLGAETIKCYQRIHVRNKETMGGSPSVHNTMLGSNVLCSFYVVGLYILWLKQPSAQHHVRFWCSMKFYRFK